VALRFSSLGSGSEGNALVVESDVGDLPTRVLIDCGFSKKELEARLAAIGLTTNDIHAILVTHEHSDHIGGVFRAAAGYGWPVHLTYGTLLAARGLSEASRGKHDIRVIDPRQPFSIGALRIEPISVPHDAREPVQYVLADKDHRFGVLTDIGHPTAHVIRALSELDGILIECNHDAKLLAASSYPPSLKRRISGPYGHLENSETSAIMSKIDLSRLRLVVAGHLSKSNNTPELAFQAIFDGLEANAQRATIVEEIEILVASQAQGIGWQSIGVSMSIGMALSA
jgi:phosphoribosyl 1,2-cyclic phosphodiesterase